MAKLRFYNAGDKIQESLSYSLPDGHDVHCIAHYLVTAPAGSFFDIPTEIEIGPATIRVEFARDLLNRFGDRGMVLVDKNREEENIGENEPIAASDDVARKKGKEKWLSFLEGIVTRHVEQCEQIRASGGAPLQARGMSKHAFDILGKEDPAALHMRVNSMPVQTPAPSGELAELRAQVKVLTDLIAGRQPLELTLEGAGKRK